MHNADTKYQVCDSVEPLIADELVVVLEITKYRKSEYSH